MTCYLRTYIDQYRPTSDHNILKHCVYRKFEFTGLLFCPRKRNSKKKNSLSTDYMILIYIKRVQL